MGDSKVISKETISRLISDVKEVKNEKLTKDGIYYKHSEEDLLKGYALIIGPQKTPYSNGNFLFQFDFPVDYPHAPPTLTYMTNDGYTRFHPNFYKNGKVCISILNTWKGEQWTGCVTIKAILLTLASLMDDKPLLNEPGITESHKDNKPYNKIIRYKTYEVAIYQVLKKEIIPKEFDNFYEIIKENFLKRYKTINEDLEYLCNAIPHNKVVNSSFYNLSIRCNYYRIRDRINDLHEKLSK